MRFLIGWFVNGLLSCGDVVDYDMLLYYYMLLYSYSSTTEVIPRHIQVLFCMQFIGLLFKKSNNDSGWVKKTALLCRFSLFFSIPGPIDHQIPSGLPSDPIQPPSLEASPTTEFWRFLGMLVICRHPKARNRAPYSSSCWSHMNGAMSIYLYVCLSYLSIYLSI